MRAFCRLLLTIEVLVCFGPMILLLGIGALLIPIQIAALIYEPLLWQGPAEVIGFVLCGVIGLTSLFFLLSKIDSGVPVRRPWLVLAGAIVGTVPLLDAVTSPMLVWQVLGALPIASGLHLLFLGRRVLLHA